MSRRVARLPRVLVVGSGRLGGVLARALQRARWPVQGFVRHAASARNWERLGIPRTAEQQADWVVLAVPDPLIAGCARAWSASAPRATLIHCAGALTLDVLRPSNSRPGPLAPPAAVASFHPLCAVSSPRDDDALTGCAVAISASRPALRTSLRTLARALGMNPISVPDAKRSAYHAGAILAAPGVLAALGAAAATWRAAGLSERDVHAALLPLTRSALRGVEARGLTAGLTGPLVRGDAERVDAHLAAVPWNVAPLYRALSSWLLSQLPDLAPATRRKLRRALEPRGP